jgi:hypothetical protein
MAFSDTGFWILDTGYQILEAALLSGILYPVSGI